MAKKMDELKKAKLMYSGELIVIAIIFIVIAILQLSHVLAIKDWHHNVFNWVTLFGGIWLVIDFIWAIFSKAKQKKICLLDKCLHLPLGIYLIVFDTLCFSAKAIIGDFYNYGISILLLAAGVTYIFEGIYHWYKPLKAILDAVEEDKKEEAKQ